MKITGRVLIYISIFIIIGVVLIIHKNHHWSLREIDDTTRIRLNASMDSIRSGEIFARIRAKSWHKDASLVSAGALFKGSQEIISKNGIINYGYLVTNRSGIGLPYVFISVSIDMKSNSIERFRVFGGERILDEPLDMKKWNIDIDTVFSRLNNQINDMIKQDNDIQMTIRAGQEIWVIAFYDKKSTREIKVIRLNAETGDTIRY